MIKQILSRGLDNNFSYFVANGKEKEIAIVDPGNVPLLEKEINMGMFAPRIILVTHSHFDHVGGVAEMIEKYGIPVYAHKNARGRLDVPDNYLVFVEDGDTITMRGLRIKVLHTPGHIDDAVCYYIDAKQAGDGVPKLLTGDTIFVEGCGRTDLKYSNVEDLYKSLQNVKKLPDETEIYPGHDYGSKPISTVAREKKNNKYFLCESFEKFKALRLPEKS